MKMSHSEIKFEDIGHRYTVDGVAVPHVTGVLHATGIVDDRWYTEECARRGTAVHVGCELMDRGVLDWSTVDQRIEPYMRAWEQFTEDMRPDWLGIEGRVFSEVHRVAGRYDRWGMVYGEPVVVDIKTGTAQRWARLQLAAYSMMLTERSGGRIERMAVELRADGRYQIYPYDHDNKLMLREDIGVFIGALNLLRWMGAEREAK